MTDARTPAISENALVSVIIPTHNRAELVGEAVQSAIDCDWPNIEIIVVDDGSTDSTSQLIADFADNCHKRGRLFQHHQQANQGPASARNSGLAIASGELIYFLDSDDLVLPGAITLLASIIIGKQVPYCVAQMAETDRHGSMVFEEGTSQSIVDHSAVVNSQWATHAVLYSRAALDSAGRFDESLKLGEDKEYLWRIVSSNPPGHLLKDVVALRRNHDFGQLSDSLTSLTMGRSAFRSLAAFVSWCDHQSKMSAEIGRAAIRPLVIALVRVGASGDFDTFSEVSALLDRLTREFGTPAHRFMTFALRIMPRGALKMALAVMSLIRATIHWRRNREQAQSFPSRVATSDKG